MLIISAGFIKVFSSKLSIKGVTRVFELFGKFLGQKEFKNYWTQVAPFYARSKKITYITPRPARKRQELDQPGLSCETLNTSVYSCPCLGPRKLSVMEQDADANRESEE